MNVSDYIPAAAVNAGIWRIDGCGGPFNTRWLLEALHRLANGETVILHNFRGVDASITIGEDRMRIEEGV